MSEKAHIFPLLHLIQHNIACFCLSSSAQYSDLSYRNPQPGSQNLQDCLCAHGRLVSIIPWTDFLVLTLSCSLPSKLIYLLTKSLPALCLLPFTQVYHILAPNHL